MGKSVTQIETGERPITQVPKVTGGLRLAGGGEEPRWDAHSFLLFKESYWNFPGSLVLKTVHLHCRGHEFDLAGELRSHMPRETKKEN